MLIIKLQILLPLTQLQLLPLLILPQLLPQQHRNSNGARQQAPPVLDILHVLIEIHVFVHLLTDTVKITRRHRQPVTHFHQADFGGGMRSLLFLREGKLCMKQQQQQ